MIQISTQTKVTKDLTKKFLEAAGKFAEAYVTIGVHEGAGQYPGGQGVYQVALWNEFGTEHIPERSFVRATIDENESKINKWRDEMMDNVITKNWSVEKALTTMGFRIQVLIQNKIKSNVPPVNAPGTIKAKQKAGVPQVTLQNSTLLLRSITFQVHL